MKLSTLFLALALSAVLWIGIFASVPIWVRDYHCVMSYWGLAK